VRCQRHSSNWANTAAASAKLALCLERARLRRPIRSRSLRRTPPESDLALLPKIRRAAPAELAGFDARLRDPRYRELLFRYRARHHPDTLDADETTRFQSWVRARLIDGRDDASRSLAARQLRIADLRATTTTTRDQELLDALDAWLFDIEREVHLYPEAAAAI
jgi:exodeoxyribonuclease-1